MNGAFAYKQVGRIRQGDRDVRAVHLALRQRGNAKKLRDGDPKGAPPVAPNKKRYEERSSNLKDAYNAPGQLVTCCFFNYPRAGETFDQDSHQPALFANRAAPPPPGRRWRSTPAWANQGGMDRARKRMRDSGGRRRSWPKRDFIVATAELKALGRVQPRNRANATARKRAQQAMNDYYQKNQNSAAAAQYLVPGSLLSAKLAKAWQIADVDTWWKRTITAFERWKPAAPKKEGQSFGARIAGSGMPPRPSTTMLDCRGEQEVRLRHRPPPLQGRPWWR